MKKSYLQRTVENLYKEALEKKGRLAEDEPLRCAEFYVKHSKEELPYAQEILEYSKGIGALRTAYAYLAQARKIAGENKEAVGEVVSHLEKAEEFFTLALQHFQNAGFGDGYYAREAEMSLRVVAKALEKFAEAVR